MIHRIQLVPIVLALGLISGSAHAALQGRDLNGSVGSFEAWYDTDLDITWLADASYAQTSGYDADGYMTLADASTWASSLSFVDTVNNLTYDNWRLPTVVDTGMPGCNSDLTGYYTGSDCGYNVATGEMAHLFYDELGNKGFYDTSGNFQSGYGIHNRSPFTDLRGEHYWSATSFPLGTGDAFSFNFRIGFQYVLSNGYTLRALAVSPGDVGAVPEADTWVMLLAGLALVGVASRRRRG